MTGEWPGVPSSSTPLPAAVRRLGRGRVARAVWANEVGGLTFELTAGAERCFVKWAPAASGLDLAAEAARLAWASAAGAAVPGVLDLGSDETGGWLVTSPVEGASAIDARWVADPSVAVAAIGRGLRALHDGLPVTGCPFSWSAADRLARARAALAAGALDSARWHDEHHGPTPEEALAALEPPPLVDRLVVCHGDACAPNTILSPDGRWSGHVDLGSLGVADRWADLAVATWSTTWNYGPGWEEHLLEAYGVAPDPERTAYYRLLWDLTP